MSYARLYPFQQVDATWLAAQKVGCLGHDMGLGKMIMAIVAMDLAAARSALVVCPGIARDTWMQEFAGWQQQKRKIQVIRSGADLRQIDGDVVICSYSLAHKVRAALHGRVFDVLILVEAQALKSVDSLRAKAVYGRGGLIGSTKRVWLLSGTLAPNHPGELWTHYRVLFGGRLEFWPFVERYCIIKQTSFGQQITGANLARTAELAEILRPFILHRRLHDVLPDLPSLRWGHIPVTPASVPPKPEIAIEEAAILGRLEHGGSISVTERMHLATLRRWTGISKAQR